MLLLLHVQAHLQAHRGTLGDTGPVLDPITFIPKFAVPHTTKEKLSVAVCQLCDRLLNCHADPRLSPSDS